MRRLPLLLLFHLAFRALPGAAQVQVAAPGGVMSGASTRFSTVWRQLLT